MDREVLKQIIVDQQKYFLVGSLNLSVPANLPVPSLFPSLGI